MVHRSIINILLIQNTSVPKIISLFFDRAVTSVREQASDDYIYTNKIEFKLVEERV